MNAKKFGILLLLIASVLLVFPLFLLIIEAMNEGYDSSVLGGLIDELQD